MKNMLQICQEVADLAATKRPENLFDGNSQHEAIFLSVAKSALDSLMRYADWQELTKEGVLRTAGDKTGYFIKSIAPDFYCLLNNTVYVKDGNEQVIGAITPEQWMRDKYFNAAGTDIKFKIQNGMIKFLQTPPNGIKIVFQYRSANIVFDADSGFEEKAQLTKNTDVPIFDEYLVKLAINWRWLKRNGMDYTEEFNEYERELSKKYASGLALKDIDLSGEMIDPADEGVVVYAAASN